MIKMKRTRLLVLLILLLSVPLLAEARSGVIDHIRITVYYDHNGTLGIDHSDGGNFKWSADSSLGSNDALIVGGDEVGVGTPPLDTLHVNGTIRQTPIDPVELAYFTNASIMDQPWSVEVVDNIAYVAAYANNTITAIDVSDPTNPSQIGYITDNTYLDGVRFLDVQGDYLYAGSIDQNPDYFVVINISNPRNMEIVGYDTGSYNGGNRLYNCQGIAAVGKYVYVNGASDMFLVFDVSDPTDPLLVGYNSTTNAEIDNPWEIEVHGDFAYISNSGNHSVTIINVTDPSHPRITGSYTNSTTLNLSRALTVRGSYAYATGLYADALSIIDISDPTNPTQVGSLIDSTELNGASGIKLAGDYAYISGINGARLAIVDISNPRAPYLVDTINTFTNVRARFEILGRHLYAADLSSDRLEIYDLYGSSLPTANIGDVATTSMDVTGSADVGNVATVGSGLNVGKGGLYVGGQFVVARHSELGNFTVKATGVAKTMYMTLAYHDGDHDCDDNPGDCCDPGYHMCTTMEWLEGGRQIEDSGTDRRTNPYLWSGHVNAGANDPSIDCDGWTSNSATNESMRCYYTTTMVCGAVTDDCDTARNVWCCSD